MRCGAPCRVQLGSLSRTTKDILREGLQGDHLFILPASLFEGKTNYADIEFLVYLNFFLRQKRRTRIVGTSRQRQVLHRLLTLTLFGLFDPAAPEPPSFEKLAEAYGVGSRETYDFLRTAHDLYGTRRDSSPGSPLLGIDDYVDFVSLEGDTTVIPLPSAEVRVVPAGRGFDVRIVQPDGRSSEKQLEVGTPPRLLRRIPTELREAIQFASDRPRFGVTPLGTSHGFDANGDCTSFIIWLDSKGILVDAALISELSEGDVFGELGLLEGGTREANVIGVAADAEVLFMSTQNFQHLVRTVPIFAWGIWDMAGSRVRRQDPSRSQPC
jgi:hypothetical protein